MLDFESGNTQYTVKVEASDGELADTATVTIRVTNADDAGKIALSADVARVGERLTATLMDQDGSKEAGKARRWQRSGDGGASWTNIAGARTRFYTPAAADAGKHLRAVFTYTDGHGPGKRAESAAVAVVGANTPLVSFGADVYTVAQGASVDVAVLLSPAGSAALSVEVVAGDAKHTVTFQPGAGTASVAIGTAGLSASDTLNVRFGDLPDGVAVGIPATTRVVVAAVAGDRAAGAVVDNGAPAELEVEFAAAAYTATAGAPGTEVTLRISPAADRRVAVPLTAVMDRGMSRSIAPEPVVFEPGDSLAAFTLDIPAEAPSGLLALGFGPLPEAVSAGTTASATVRIAARDDGALRDEAFDVGLAVFGRAVAEGARQAVGARIDAVMRPSPGGSAAPGSPSGWAGRAAGTLASLADVSLNPSSAAEIGRRSGSPELPGAREAAARLLPSVSFATSLGPQSARGLSRFGLWAEGSAQSFRGEPGVEYDGGLRALTVGADARIGSSALFGVSLMRSDGDLDYKNRSMDGSIGHAMNSVHPYLFVQPSPGIGLWAMAGYGSGEVGDEDHRRDTGDASLRMLSGGLNAPLAQRGAFGLALKSDAFTVGMRDDDGPARGRGIARTRPARSVMDGRWTQTRHRGRSPIRRRRRRHRRRSRDRRLGRLRRPRARPRPQGKARARLRQAPRMGRRAKARVRSRHPRRRVPFRDQPQPGPRPKRSPRANGRPRIPAHADRRARTMASRCRGRIRAQEPCGRRRARQLHPAVRPRREPGMVARGGIPGRPDAQTRLRRLAQPTARSTTRPRNQTCARLHVLNHREAPRTDTDMPSQTTGRNPANQVRDSRFQGTVQQDPAQRQKAQIVQSRIQLDDLLP